MAMPLARAVRRAIPLAPEHKKELVDKFATVIRATVKGNLLVAAIQGALGGIAFWFLGVGAALLWGGADGLPVAAAGRRRRAGVAAGGDLLLHRRAPSGRASRCSPTACS